jgi:hypothetical protein
VAISLLFCKSQCKCIMHALQILIKILKYGSARPPLLLQHFWCHCIFVQGFQ